MIKHYCVIKQNHLPSHLMLYFELYLLSISQARIKRVYAFNSLPDALLPMVEATAARPAAVPMVRLELVVLMSVRQSLYSVLPPVTTALIDSPLVSPLLAPQPFVVWKL